MTRDEALVLDKVRRCMNLDRVYHRRLMNSASEVIREAGYRVTELLRLYQYKLKPLFDIASKTLKEK